MLPNYMSTSAQDPERCFICPFSVPFGAESCDQQVHTSVGEARPLYALHSRNGCPTEFIFVPDLESWLQVCGPAQYTDCLVHSLSQSPCVLEGMCTVAANRVPYAFKTTKIVPWIPQTTKYSLKHTHELLRLSVQARFPDTPYICVNVAHRITVRSH